MLQARIPTKPIAALAAARVAELTLRLSMLLLAVSLAPDSVNAQVNPPPPSWMDNSHGYLTGQATQLTQWVDQYFGAAEVDQEAASSRLRLRFVQQWDQRLPSDFRVRVRGKVNLPALSKRLDLVFRGEDPADDINGQADPSQSQVGLQYQLTPEASSEHRFDATVGLNSSGPRPGLRYRYQTSLSELYSLRYTHRVQYEFDEGANTTARFFLDRKLSDNQLLRSYSRMYYGEKSRGVEWTSALSHIARWRDAEAKAGLGERATWFFAEVSGVTEPVDYIANYRVGARYRRQTYRDYLFLEIEPSYNWRIDEPYMPRAGAWQLELRFEFLLFESLRRDEEALARR